jgi:hypothetical protein
VLAGPGDSIPSEHAKASKLRKSLDAVVQSRNAACTVARNPFTITDLHAGFAVRGRTGSVSYSGIATATDLSEVPEYFNFVLCSDANSTDPSLAPYLIDASFGPDASHLTDVVLAEKDVRIISSDPLTFLCRFPITAQVKSQEFASTGRFAFRIAACWPGGVWRLLDMAVLDTRGLGTVVGDVRVTFVAPYDIHLQRGLYTLASNEFQIDRGRPTELSAVDRASACALVSVPATEFKVGLGFHLANPTPGQLDVFQFYRPVPTR